MRPHTKRPCEKRKHQGETECGEYHREVQESVTDMVRFGHVKRRDQDYVGRNPLEMAPSEAEMDGLCQPRHESHRNDESRGT